nr:hypothetical protein [Tanacetum cinerariifolium]
MTNLEDITDPTTAMNMALALMTKAFKLNYSTPTNNNQRISSNPRNRQIAQPGMNMGQDRQMQMVGGNGENQFRQYAGQNVGNLNGYNDIQNVRNQVIQHAVQNPRIQNVENQNGLIGVPGNVNQNLNGNGNLVAAHAEGNATGHNGNQIRYYNCRGVGHFARNCTVRPKRRDVAYLQTQLLIAQKEEAGIQLQAEEFDLMAAVADLDEIEEVNANCILMANLQQASTSGTQTDKALVYDSDGSAENDNNVISEDSSVEQSGRTVEQHPANVEETHTLNSLSQKLENENVELEFQVLNYAKENAYLKTTYKNLFDSISVTRTRTKTIIDSLQNKLQETIYENAKLRAQLFDKVSDQKDTTSGKSANTKFVKKSILGKPPKVGGIHALSKPVTSNSIPTPQGSKVVKNAKVIAPGMTKPITVSQPPVINKKVVNYNPNGVDNTKTRRPQPRSNTKNDRVPSASKSSRSKNKEVDVEEHHRQLLLFRNKKHMSSECNNIKLATQNVRSKVVCAMCKKCLNSINHDVCLLYYVNGMNSRGKKQKENVSINKHQKKQKPKVKKTKKVRFIERLASPKPNKPRAVLRWSPTRRMFDLTGKIIASSESESQFDCSKGDNACISNPLEPTIKRFTNYTLYLAGNPNMFMVRRLGLFQAYDQKSTASYKFCLEVFGNCSLLK